jgi:hypothetical protein
VPRLKSLGYSKVYRKFSDAETGHPQRDSNADDTEIDSGPWGFTLGPITGAATPVLFGTVANNKNIYTYDAMGIYTMYNEVGIGSRAYGIANRVECAVKFTNLGIPSNLWIRLSVLNTDGTLALINSGGFNSLATQE